MTRKEACAVARAISETDGGCPYCVSGICDNLNASNLGWLFGLADQGDPDRVTEDGAGTIALSVRPA